MARKKKAKFSWISTLVIGIAIGIVSQRIPEARAYEDKANDNLSFEFSCSH